MSVSQLIRDTAGLRRTPTTAKMASFPTFIGGTGTGAQYLSKKMAKIFMYTVDRARFPTMTGYGTTWRPTHTA